MVKNLSRTPIVYKMALLEDKMPNAIKIIKLAEDLNLQPALLDFVSKANDINMEIAGVLLISPKKYKLAGIFYPDKPKNGTLKYEIIIDEGDFDRALSHTEEELNKHPERDIVARVMIHCFSHKTIIFWRE